MEKVTMKELAEYKERMIWAKEHNDKEEFFKYYNLYKAGYEQITGKNFEEQMEEK